MVLKRIRNNLAKKVFPKRTKKKENLQRAAEKFWKRTEGLSMDERMDKLNKVTNRLAVKMALDGLRITSPKKRKKIRRLWEIAVSHAKLQREFGKDPNRIDQVDKGMLIALEKQLGNASKLGRFSSRIKINYKTLFREFTKVPNAPEDLPV